MFCCTWGGFLFLRLYLGSLGTLVFMSLDSSPSLTQGMRCDEILGQDSGNIIGVINDFFYVLMLT